MANRGRVVLFHGTGIPLETREVSIPDPRRGEILVRVTMCTLCGSDLHTYHGRRSTPTPTILGHEILGTIATFGADVIRQDCTGSPLAEGDLVSWSLAVHCGGCFYCAHELPQKCEKLIK